MNGAALTATGNVITGTDIVVGFDGNSTDGNADAKGTDGAKITQVAGVTTDTTPDGSHNFQVTGQFGTLVINENGGYTYTRFNGARAEGNDVFTYTLTDGDGDFSTAKLTVSISDHGVTASVTAGGAVSEAGLPARGLEPAGSDEAANSETTTGSSSYTAADGPAVVTIGGVAVTAVGQTFAGSHGTLEITSRAAGSVGYRYTLTDNTFGQLDDGHVCGRGDRQGRRPRRQDADDCHRRRHTDGERGTRADRNGNRWRHRRDQSAGQRHAGRGRRHGYGSRYRQWLPDDCAGRTILTNAFGTYAFQADGTWSFDPNAEPEQRLRHQRRLYL